MESRSQEEKSSGRLGASLLLGSHLSMKSPDFYLGTCQTALRYGETAFMFYTGAPQSSKRAPLATLKIEEGRAFVKEHHFDEKAIVVHAPYILNLGNNSNAESYQAGIALLRGEIIRSEAFGASLLVFHPGNATGLPLTDSLLAVAQGIDQVYEGLDSHVTLCLETMAGKGSEVGKNFDEIAQIISLSHMKDRLGVCFDTCHVNDEGVALGEVDEVLDDFDRVIGLSRLKVIHLNDSKNPLGSHKDRHENIGYGTIGFDVLSSWTHSPRLLSVPKILETPTDGIHNPYAKEIAMLRENRYVKNWRENLIAD